MVTKLIQPHLSNKTLLRALEAEERRRQRRRQPRILNVPERRVPATPAVVIAPARPATHQATPKPAPPKPSAKPPAVKVARPVTPTKAAVPAKPAPVATLSKNVLANCGPLAALAAQNHAALSRPKRRRAV